MDFEEFEILMQSKGINSLASIARALNTTPQAVSNWKSRNQIPHHVLAKINFYISDNSIQKSGQELTFPNQLNFYPRNIVKEENLSISDIILTLAQQMKVIILCTLFTAFIAYNYISYIQIPKFISKATILLPENNNNNMGNLAGLASQFGVNVPSGVNSDLSSPSLFPELIKSRRFAEKLLKTSFYSEKLDEELSLLSYLTQDQKNSKLKPDEMITLGYIRFNNMIEFIEDKKSSIAQIKVTAQEAILSKEIADEVISELDNLSRFFKSQSVIEKIQFINQRISSVEADLKSSEQRLKAFNEKNRQIYISIKN